MNIHQFPCLISRAEAIHMDRAEAKGVKSVHVEYAVDKVLSDMADVTDWLGGWCLRHKNVDSDQATRVPGRLASSESATVFHAAVKAADRGDAEGCLAAMQIIVSRYLIHQDGYLREFAEEYARGDQA